MADVFNLNNFNSILKKDAQERGIENISKTPQEYIADKKQQDNQKKQEELNARAQYASDKIADSGLAWVVKDTNGNTIGNVWSGKDVAQAFANKKIKKQDMYYNTDTKQFSNERQNTGSFEFSDGKVKIEAPKEVLESDWYKQNFKDNDSFRALVGLYKNDPSGKFELEIDEPVKDENGNIVKDEDGKEKTEKKKTTLNDLLGSFKKDFDNNSKIQMERVSFINNVKYNTGGAIQLADSDLSIYDSVNNITRDNNKKDEKTPVFIPTAAADQFSGYDSWDDASSSVSAKDFYDWYHLDHGDNKGEVVAKMWDDVENEIVNLVTTSDLSEEYSPEERAKKATEYARAVSFYSLLKKEKPEASFATSASLAAKSALLGLGQGASDFVIGAARIANFAVSSVISQPTAGFTVLYAVMSDFVSGGPERVMDNLTKNLSLYGEVTQGAISLLDEPLKNLHNFISITTNRELDEMSKIYTDTKFMYGVGNFIEKALEQVVYAGVGAAVGGAVAEGMVNALPGLSETVAITMAAENIADLGTGLATVARSSSTLVGTSKSLASLTRLASFMANEATQGVLEASLDDNDKLMALVDGATEAEIAEFGETVNGAILSNMLFDTAIDFAGKQTVGRALRWFKGTTAGKVAQAQGRKVVNTIGLGGRKVGEAARNLVEGIGDKLFKGTEKSAGSVAALGRDASNLRKQIIEIQKNIKETKLWKNEKGVKAGAEEINALTKQRIEVEVRYDRLRKTGKALEKAKIIDATNAEYKETRSLTAKIIQQERAEGKFVASTGTYSGETNDYIQDLYSRIELNNKKTVNEKLSKSDQATLEAIEARINAFEANHSSELVKLAQQKLDSMFKYYTSLTNYLSSDAGGNLLDAEKLAGYRASGNWGTGENGVYQWMPRMKDTLGIDDGTEKALMDILTNPINSMDVSFSGSYKVKTDINAKQRVGYNADTKFFDINFVMDGYIEGAARARMASDLGSTVINGPKVKGRKIIDANKYVSKSGVATSRADINEQIKTSFDNIIKDYRLGTAARDVTIGKQGEKNIKKRQNYFANRKKRAVSQRERFLNVDNLNGRKSYVGNLNADDFSVLRSEFDIPEYGTVSRKAEFDEMYSKMSKKQKKIVQDITETENPNMTRYNNAIRNTDLGDRLSKSYVQNNKEILNSTTYKNIVSQGRAADLAAEEQLILQGIEKDIVASSPTKKTVENMSAEEFEGIVDKNFAEDVRGFLDQLSSDTSESIIENPFVKNVLSDLEDSGIASEDVREYLVLDWLHSNRSKVKSSVLDYLREGSSKTGASGIKVESARGYSENFTDKLDKLIESRLNKMTNKMMQNGGDGIIDYKSLEKRVSDYMLDIADEVEKTSSVKILNNVTGKYEIWELPNYTVELLENAPTRTEYNMLVQGLAKLNNIARKGQIVINIGSLATQGFRDTLNSNIAGGLGSIWTKDATKKELANFFGPNMTKEISDAVEASSYLIKGSGNYTTSELFGDLSREAKENKQLMNEYFNGRNGKNRIPTNRREVTKNQKFWKESGAKVKNAFDDIKDKAGLHNIRERTLRAQNYRQALVDATKEGYSLKEAQLYAEFVMNNATTNFNRALTWGNSFARAIPYYGAAVNGMSSMWRLFEVDPVGVTWRFMNGLIIPTIGLTAMSCASESDREIYNNIPEYEKEDNLVFVLNGETHRIPIPQELSSFVAPFRIATEKMAGGNDSLSFMELMTNNVLGMPVIPLDGIMMLDEKKMGADPTVGDRLSNLALTMFNDLAPATAKTAYMLATGKDPFTSSPIDLSNLVVDEDGDEIIQDKNEYEFATWLSGKLNGWGVNTSASWIEGILKSITGRGVLNITNDIYYLGEAVTTGDIANGVGNVINQALKNVNRPVSGTSRTDLEQSRISWYAQMSDIENRKAQVEEKLEEYNNKLNSNTITDQQRKKYTSLRETARQEYQEFVINSAKKFIARFPDYYTRNYYLGTLAALRFTDYAGKEDTYDLQKAASSLYFAEDDEAKKTLYREGFTGPTDRSVFGYLKKGQDGSVSMEYYTPTTVAFAETVLDTQYGGRAKDVLSSVKAAIDYSGLNKKYYDEIQPKVNALYDKKDYNGVDKLYATWDAEVMKEIIPYINQYGLDGFFDKSEVIDYLDNYIKVPTSYMGKGKYISSKSGINKNRGYAQSYIKFIYNKMQEEEGK